MCHLVPFGSLHSTQLHFSEGQPENCGMGGVSAVMLCLCLFSEQPRPLWLALFDLELWVLGC